MEKVYLFMLLLFQVLSSTCSDGKYPFFWNTCYKLYWSYSTCFYKLTNFPNIFLSDATWTSLDWSFTRPYFSPSSFVILGSIINPNLNEKRQYCVTWVSLIWVLHKKIRNYDKDNFYRLIQGTKKMIESRRKNTIWI